MSYLKSMATSFVYIAFFLAVITFSPGFPPNAEFSEYSVTPPAELVGVLAPNERLNSPEILFAGEVKGPENFDSYNGELYTGMHGGHVGKIVGNKIVPVVKFGTKCDGVWQEEKCGRPLGFKFDKQGRLYVVDTYYGIFKVDVKTGKYEKLFDISKPVDGLAPIFINSVDIADNGDVYYTETSTKFKLYDGVFAMLANPSGRLSRYNAATKKIEVLLTELAFGNGLRLSEDQSFLIVAQTLTANLLKYHLKGAKAGKAEIFADGLPGTPDNIHSDGQGNFLVSLVLTADRDHPQFAQTIIPHPYIRKMLARLMGLAELPFKLLDDVYPNDFAKKIIHALGSFETVTFMHLPKVTVLRIAENGKIIDALHNSDEKLKGISSAFIHDDYLWLGSPWNEHIARVPLKQAFPNAVFSKRVTREVPKSEKPVATPSEAKKPNAAPSEAAKPKTAPPPATTEPPKVAKPAKIEKIPENNQKVPKKVETVKKEIPVRENEPTKPAKRAQEPKKMANDKQSKEELPKPIKEADKKNTKQPEATKTVKKDGAPKRNAKISDEI